MTKTTSDAHALGERFVPICVSLTFPAARTLNPKKAGLAVHHLVVIVSSYDRHLHHFPIIARQGIDRVFMFVDHRTPVRRRQKALAEHIDITDIASMEAYYTTPAPSCDHGTHMWDSVYGEDGAIVAVRCPRCGVVEELPEPFPARVGTIRRVLAPTG